LGGRGTSGIRSPCGGLRRRVADDLTGGCTGGSLSISAENVAGVGARGGMGVEGRCPARSPAAEARRDSPPRTPPTRRRPAGIFIGSGDARRSGRRLPFDMILLSARVPGRWTLRPFLFPLPANQRGAAPPLAMPCKSSHLTVAKKPLLAEQQKKSAGACTSCRPEGAPNARRGAPCIAVGVLREAGSRFPYECASVFSVRPTRTGKAT